MLRYRLPDGRSWKRLLEGCCGVLHDAVGFAGASCKENKCPMSPMIFAAVFTVRWRVLRSAALQFPYQTVMQLFSTLSMVECVGEVGFDFLHD